MKVFDENIKTALNTLVGNVEWIYSTRNLRDGLDVVFRIDGELRGLSIYQRQIGNGFDDAPRVRVWSETVIETLSRKRTLAAAARIETGLKPLELLNHAEHKEWARLCEEDRRKQEVAERERQAAEKKWEREEYERLREKYGGEQAA